MKTPTPIKKLDKNPLDLHMLSRRFKWLKHFAVSSDWLRIWSIFSSLCINLLVHRVTESGYAHRYWVYLAVIITKDVAHLKYVRESFKTAKHYLYDI